MQPIPVCHWRGGGPSNGYICKSRIVAPAGDKPVDRAACLACACRNHFDVGPERVAEVVAEVKPEPKRKK